VNVIARAIVPTGVKKMMAPASTGFRFVPFLFCAGSALFIRLTARLFVSHNCIFLGLFVSCFALARTRVAANFHFWQTAPRQASNSLWLNWCSPSFFGVMVN
jgi:hypothetical protein